MSTIAEPSPRRCTVVGPAKLTGTLSSDAICREVERAIAVKAPQVSYTIEISVVSPSRLAATPIVNDHKLPVQNFAVMDGDLSERAVRNFADSLAAAVKAAGS